MKNESSLKEIICVQCRAVCSLGKKISIYIIVSSFCNRHTSSYFIFMQLGAVSRVTIITSSDP